MANGGSVDSTLTIQRSSHNRRTAGASVHVHHMVHFMHELDLVCPSLSYEQHHDYCRNGLRGHNMGAIES